MGAVLGIAVAGFAAIGWAASRPQTIVEFAAGRSEVTRGRLPRGLADDLSGTLKLSPQANGRLEIRGRGDSLKLKMVGLDEGTEQRVRNVVLLRKRELGTK
jgi:hypothetical protein